MKVFWAWQSDQDAKVCRNFIKGALEKAITDLAKEAEVEDSERPELDHDTKSTPGLPDIVATIFEKIAKASVFVADITTIARTRRRKALANPNVLVELGFAKRAVGVDRIVLVANGYWYKGPKDLPFDLRNRRGPIVFTLAPDATEDDRRKVKSALVGDLKSALKEILIVPTASEASPRIQARDRNRSVWFPKGTVFKHHGYQGSGGEVSAVPEEAPRAYMRIMGADWKESAPTRARLQTLNPNTAVWPIHGSTSGDGGLNTEGLLLYGFTDRRDGVRVVHSAAQIFRASPEIWAFNTAIRSGGNPVDYLALGAVLPFWRTTLQKGVTLLKQLSAKGPYEIEAGIVGLEKMHWPDRLNHARAVDNEAFLSRKSAAWNEDEQDKFLKDLESVVADAFGLAAS